MQQDKGAIDLSLKSVARVGLQLFALSFASLFLELMLIRWVPAMVRLVAYYANLMLISSFLGLGLGAMLAGRRWKLFGWFPLLLVINVTVLVSRHDTILPISSQEARFFAEENRVVNYLTLVAIFVLNTLLFMPLGQRIGELFRQLPPLRAYSWDLSGSLAGTICFGVFSLCYFSPLLGLTAVAVIYLVLAPNRGRLAGVVLLPVALGTVYVSTEPGAVWSPYHYISIAERKPPYFPPAGEPPPDLRAMHDPPIYFVRVGRHFYQQNATLDLRRYSPGASRDWIVHLNSQYLLPFQLAAQA
jgi:hypothetical protein